MAHVIIQNGVVVTMSANAQPGIPGFTEIDDSDPRIAAFLSPSAKKPQSITATQFLNRIPPAVLPVLWGNPQTGIMLLTLAAANMIDLTDPQVQGGINALVPSVLTAAQAAAILDH
jgi:hypothetical protein